MFLRKLFKNKNIFFRRLLSKFEIRKFNNHNYTIFYDKDKSNELSELANLHKTNKGYVSNQSSSNNLDKKGCHNYSDYYSDIFLTGKDHIKKVFELGIGSINDNQKFNMNHQGENYKTGGSLRMWRDYFKNAKIYGADVDKDCFFTEDRIKTFYVDQGDKDSIINMWKQIDEKEFDIIIDDGCHRFEETIIFFENSLNKLKKGGVYIIEDILLSQRKKFLKYFKSNNTNFKFVDFYRPDAKLQNNSLIIIIK